MKGRVLCCVTYYYKEADVVVADTKRDSHFESTSFCLGFRVRGCK